MSLSFSMTHFSKAQTLSIIWCWRVVNSLLEAAAIMTWRSWSLFRSAIAMGRRSPAHTQVSQDGLLSLEVDSSSQCNYPVGSLLQSLELKLPTMPLLKDRDTWWQNHSHQMWLWLRASAGIGIIAPQESNDSNPDHHENTQEKRVHIPKLVVHQRLQPLREATRQPSAGNLRRVFRKDGNVSGHDLSELEHWVLWFWKTPEKDWPRTVHPSASWKAFDSRAY